MRTDKRFDHDVLNMVPARKTSHNTLGVINAVQDHSPEEQVAAIAATFLLMCEHYDIEPRQALTVSSRIINHSEGKYPEFAGVRDYMENEL